MDLFDIEREVARHEGMRIAFTRKKKNLVLTRSYKETHPIRLPDDCTLDELVERVVEVVGHDCPFLVILDAGQNVTLFNTQPKQNLN